MSLRAKQAWILLIATVLPFALGGAAVAFIVAPAYHRTVLTAARESTLSLADHLAWSVSRDAGRLQRLAGLEGVRAAVRKPKDTPKGTLRIAERWATLGPQDPQVRSVLQHPVTSELRWWRQANPSVRELVLTDLSGRVVAATSKPSHYLLRGERWWQQAFDGGRGRVVISRPEPAGDSATGPEGWQVTMAVPIYAEGRPGSMVAGIVRVVMDLPRAFEEVERLNRTTVGNSDRVLLTDMWGRIILSARREPPRTRTLPRAVTERMTAASAATDGGSRFLKLEGQDRLLAWGPVRLDDVTDMPGALSPRLFVVTEAEPERYLGALYQVQRWMLVIALVTIAVAVGLGYWLADRIIARQIRAIAAGMRELARGDFESAGRIADELCRVEGGKPRGMES